MGYQEALLPINYLAEAPGVKKAIEEYSECYELPGYCGYFGTVHHASEGSMYVCFNGDSSIVGQIAQLFAYRCYSRGFDYSDRYEVIDDSLTERAARQRPDLASAAYKRAKSAFKTVIEKDRVRREELKEESIRLWPEVASFLLRFGPTTLDAFKAISVFEDHAMPNVINYLERQGLVETVEGRNKDEVMLTEKAYGVLHVDPKPVPQSLEEKLDLALKEFEALNTSSIAAFLNVSTTKANKILKEQMEAGHIVKVTRGRMFLYRLNNEDSAEQKAS